MGGPSAQRAKEHRQATQEESELASPPRPPKPRPEILPPPGFKGVITCLQEGLPPDSAVKAPMEIIQLEVMVKPAMAIMCTTHIVQDETTGVTYMDTVTTSVERVAFRSSCMLAHPPRPTIEDVTDLC